MTTDLKKLSTVEIVDVYNKQAKKLGEKPVKRFATRAAAVKRTKTIMELTKPVKGGKPLKYKAKNGRPTKELNLASRANGKDVRAGSLAEKVLVLLKKGATHDQLAKAIGGTNAPGRVRTLLLRMNTHNGIGIAQTGDTFKASR